MKIIINEQQNKISALNRFQILIGGVILVEENKSQEFRVNSTTKKNKNKNK